MPKIDEMYAFVADDDENPGDEGVIGFQTPEGWMAMVGADMAMVDKLRPLAEGIAKATGTKIRLLHFTQCEELETLGG